MNTILEVRDLGISFGSNQVLKSVSFDLYENEILGVIGPNGAGKTVMLNILSGILKPGKGSVSFMGRDILPMSIVERTRLGFGRTFQIPRSFENMTAYENGLIGSVYGTGATERAASLKVPAILEMIGLSDRKGVFAGKLGLIDRKRLEIGVALASNPKLLLLDEVAGGLTESEVSDILGIVRGIKEAGVSVIWIEHVLQTMLEGTDRVMLLAEGRDVVCGPPEAVMSSKEVETAYLGA
ncbi:MAG: ATP-binding cassette domain-containing protein [Clostridiales Family XIII bacterium]|nr:ATP-binding cassette domain-containing protein [Clostridiales Family XIII bacterium]